MQRFFSRVTAITIGLLSPLSAFAQGCTGLRDCATKNLRYIGGKPILNGSSGVTVYDIIGQIIFIALSFVGIVFVLITIYGGFQWMTAGGNESQVSEAKAKIYNGIAGAVIVFAAYVLTSFVLGQACQLTGVLCT